MGTKTVSDSHQRSWSVRRTIAWTLPATDDEVEHTFEHDVDGGRGSALMVISALVLFWVIVIAWTPAGTHIPWFLWLLLAAAVLFFPIRWVVRRQREIVVETAGDYRQKAEKWTGLVRGGAKSREEVRIIERQLRTQGTPRYVDSPLKQDLQLEAAEERRLHPPAAIGE